MDSGSIWCAAVLQPLDGAVSGTGFQLTRRGRLRKRRLTRQNLGSFSKVVVENMSYVPSDRPTRQDDIKKGLQFIQSSLPFFGSDCEYEIFLKKLVINLFNEGNDLFREGRTNDSVNQYSEALSIADYATSEDISIPKETLERLYSNRAASYSDMGFHENALKDCEAALSLNPGNLRALYRKSNVLYMLEKYKEAYDAIASCSLTAPQDESVVKLTQELAAKLNLKIRKAYVRAQPDLQMCAIDVTSKTPNTLAEQIEPDITELTYEAPFSSFQPLTVASDSSDFVSNPTSISPNVHSDSMSFPSALASNGASSSFSMSYMRDGDIIGDELDHILDSVPDSNNLNLSSGLVPAPLSSFSSDLPDLMPGFHRFSLSDIYSHSLTSAFDSFSLNSLSSVDSQGGHLNGALNSCLIDPSSFTVTSSYFSLPESPPRASENMMKTSMLEGLGNGMSSVTYFSTHSVHNPLEDTHEFRQACQLCLSNAGLKFQCVNVNLNLDHKCKKDIFIGRIKNSMDSSWKRIRPRPTKNQYVGPFYICKDVAQGGECTYPGHCTFAYSQEEIDVWTLERKGTFCRETLFGGDGKVRLTIPYLLQEYPGNFMFLCEKCFEHKPRIISKENKDSPQYCSHPALRHDFNDNKCLVHIFKDTAVKYFKIRPYNSNLLFDLCRHEVRYGCMREDECFYAHSLVELRVWVMQKETGISLNAIVQESTKYSGVPSSVSRQQLLNTPNPGYPIAKIKFVCGQCWRNGQVMEADKNRKYCSAKARHPWTKDRQVVLVMSNERKKWMTIRPFPTKKPVPLQFELCNHIVTGKKCQFVGNCSFAHCPEEKDIWTYMKEHGIQDMEQLYENLTKSKRSGKEVTTQTTKQIVLPTDYAETTVDFHCWLCGKNCNSERQWKMHISSERHKEKVFHSEDDQSIWQHRFPTGCFSICEKFLSGTCSDGEKCKYAHGNAELLEWNERRKVLRQKLFKVRKDQLINPDDNDFGKYSFLINDLN
ncbi:zinc finger CCCH domain-containing 7A [Pelobates cultripes]|uniref:Zinc finger CCCH domain-containing 7A n=2 Tax=Pelobates cultripes TaxID=61616 RepID=A0AAD1SP23_PELCU|nr:zinc finger CCCH domain-containing 7A [Pelobates cultripes]